LGEFVAGPENRLVDFALRGFLSPAPTPYSPLVLYGPHGAGKSHLALGLVAHWRRRNPDQQVRCLTCGEFAREHAAAIAKQRVDAWQQELAASALLVLEDLGQLAGKRGAQHELVQLLDALADGEAQVVLTARTLPAHSPVLLPELASRLSAGLSVPVQLPAAATRRAILERLAAARGLSVSQRTVQGLADSFDATVPALLAALLELDVLNRTAGRPVDERRVRQYMSQRHTARVPNLREIATLTARYFGLTLADLKSPRRRQPLVAGRGVAMYLARKLTDKSFEEIGAYFGGRDHTTVLHGCRRTESLLARDRATRLAVTELKRLLHAC
jgi:chromosomal replication initiator protein